MINQLMALKSREQSEFVSRKTSTLTTDPWVTVV